MFRRSQICEGKAKLFGSPEPAILSPTQPGRLGSPSPVLRLLDVRVIAPVGWRVFDAPAVPSAATRVRGLPSPREACA